EPRRDRHRQRRYPANVSAYHRLELQSKPDTADAQKDDRQPYRPQIPAKQTLREQKNVKVKRTVIIGRIVTVKPVLHDLIDEPSVDALVEVWWLHSQEEEAQERRQREDQPRHPIRSFKTNLPRLQVIARSRRGGSRFY